MVLFIRKIIWTKVIEQQVRKQIEKKKTASRRKIEIPKLFLESENLILRAKVVLKKFLLDVNNFVFPL